MVHLTNNVAFRAKESRMAEAAASRSLPNGFITIIAQAEAAPLSSFVPILAL